MLFACGLAFSLPAAARGAPPSARPDAKEEKKPSPQPDAVPSSIPEPEVKRFSPLRMPAGPKDENPNSANAGIRKISESLNKELDAAYVEAERTGNPDLPAGVMERRLPELNALGQKAELDASVREQISKYDLQTGDYQGAMKLSDTTLRSQPENRDALNNRAGARFGLGDYAGAIVDATKVTKLDPGNSTAYAVRSLAYYGSGDYQQAIEDARRALSIDPDDKTAFSVMKLSEGRLKPTVTLPEEKIEQGLEVQREYQGMVQQLNQVEERSRALSEEAVPRPVEKLVRLAANKISVKDYWGAIQEADKMVSLEPGFAEAYYLRAAAYNLVGKYAEAAKDASQALLLNPNDTASRDARSWANYRLGKFQEALADSNHSLELNPRNAYAYANRGFINERLGDFQAMVSDLKAAASLNPQFEPALRDAVSRSNLEKAPLLTEPPAVRRPLPDEPRPRSSRKRSFAAVMATSLVGGFLIALGLLHIMTTQWQRRFTAELNRSRADTGGIRQPSAIDATYEVGRILGQGGMGVVYEGLDRALKRKVAIKMLRPELKADPRDRERFLEEARTVAALHHSSIVEIYSILEDKAGLYLVFEFIEGRSVEQLLLDKKHLSLAETKAILKRVCEALDYAHHHNVVHRDLKPSNIMITADGAVKVMDFGIAKAAKETTGALNMTNTILGTPFYMAPEQGSGVVRKESDIFSLGACLYEMTTGERPYPSPASTPMKLEARYPKPSHLAALPEGLDALVDAALHPDPDKRIRTARDFWTWLDKIRDPAGTRTPHRPS
ncbi:MAG: protein kinase [Elusimicrobia bacterium]|nr:protein kinase [Elusimicrobiota bacterium]